MAQSSGRVRVVGEYVVGRQIGAGSFSVVWHARHRVHGTEVAIKEIATSRLNKKLEESLMSEIVILKNVNHPNIIRLHEMIKRGYSEALTSVSNFYVLGCRIVEEKEDSACKTRLIVLWLPRHENVMEPGKIHLVLEFCKGGDLSMFIQKRQGRIPESTAKHFMYQLAAGLKILRDHHLIHRDLKPQNLLLSTNDDNSVLKIADFGFASKPLIQADGTSNEAPPGTFQREEALKDWAIKIRLTYYEGSDKYNTNKKPEELSFLLGRSLQPKGLAETLCGSPLYMAPEIMQLQRYDAKADLWSVGAILFQLVTGRTPFTGSNQIQLLQNILKSIELQFPSEAKDLSSECIDLCRKLLRRNPVERLTFEEFFNHPFLSQRQPDDSLSNKRPTRVTGGLGGFPLPERNPVRSRQESSQEECLPFSLDDDSSGPDGSPSFVRRSPMRSTYGFSLDTKIERREVANTSDKDFSSTYGSVREKPENTGLRFGSRRSSGGNLKESLKSMDHRAVNSRSEVVDSLELIYQDYVLVSGPPVDVSSSSASASKLSQLQSKSVSPPVPSGSINSTTSAPVPIFGQASSNLNCIGSLGSHSSAPSGTSQGSMDIGDASEQPSTDCMTRIKSLQHCASAITELVNEKIGAGRQLEAFSIQLVILAIWKQALHICHTQAASAIEGSPTQENTRVRETIDKEHGSSDIQECLDFAKTQGPEDICSEIERAFLLEVANAEELAKVIEPGGTEMPDAMETIFQSALTLGRHGALRPRTTVSYRFLALPRLRSEPRALACHSMFLKVEACRVDEYMGNMENAAVFYAKAVRVLAFLLVEAPSLILNPPFSLTNSDRYRLRTYIDVLNNRQSHSRSQRMALLKCDDLNCPPQI
ncbi:hypothetical protein RJ640_014350 [Escallonia rubra]|uniref:Protein kinase domain-containing protein n=1 Tax=Escallonia rubra TaxID=112253 RepID=A0AA88QMA8_9ASTE|nr:hypothetical protein RJ640_014350 [Escallonia rubra]